MSTSGYALPYEMTGIELMSPSFGTLCNLPAERGEVMWLR